MIKQVTILYRVVISKQMYNRTEKDLENINKISDYYTLIDVYSLTYSGYNSLKACIDLLGNARHPEAKVRIRE